MLARLYKIRQELGKFFSVGLLAYIVGVGGYNALVHAKGAPLASKPLTASVISGVISILVAYFGNRHWTWKDRQRTGARREITLFFLINGIALVFGVIDFVIFAGSRLYVTGSISTKTGFAPICTIAAVDATKEFGGVITSSPGLIPKATKPHTNASVPLFRPLQYFVLQ